MHSVILWPFPINWIKSSDYLEVEIIWVVLLAKFWQPNPREILQGESFNDLKVEPTEPSRPQSSCNPISHPMPESPLQYAKIPRPAWAVWLLRPLPSLHTFPHKIRFQDPFSHSYSWITAQAHSMPHLPTSSQRFHLLLLLLTTPLYELGLSFGSDIPPR